MIKIEIEAHLEKTYMLMALVMRAKKPRMDMATPSTQYPQAPTCRKSSSPYWPQLCESVSELEFVELSNRLVELSNKLSDIFKLF